MAGKLAFSIQPTENYFVVTRQRQVETDEEGNAIFETGIVCRETLQLAVQEIRVSLDALMKQAEKDGKLKK